MEVKLHPVSTTVPDGRMVKWWAPFGFQHWAVNSSDFSTALLHFARKEPLNRWLVVSQYGGGKQKNVMSLLGIENRSSSPASHDTD